MRRHILLPLALSLAIITPVLAEDPPAPVDPVVAEANQQKARAEALKAAADAQKAQYDSQKARAESLLAPLRQFAGTGTNQVAPSTTQMEATYLAAIAMQDVARIIDRRVSDHVDGAGGRSEPQVVLLGATEAYSFDNFVAFEIEAGQIMESSLLALRATGPACPPPRTAPAGSRVRAQLLPAALPGLIATAGSLIGLLQTDTNVQSYDGLADEVMLVNALAGRHGNFYIRQDALLLSPPQSSNPIMQRLASIGVCEASLKAEVQIHSPAQGQTNAQKARVAEMTLVLAHIVDFSTRWRTAAADGRPLIAAALRQELLQRSTSPYVLRVKIDRAGGTLITRKNLWTALGAPAIILSGGVIADYSLSDRRSGALLLGGAVVCRSGMTGLRSAIRLDHADIVCADDGPDTDRRNYTAPRPRSAPRQALDYDSAVFRRVARD